MQTDMGEMETDTERPKLALKQNRQFLDYFWDIAKPERELRLTAIDGLIQYLKKNEKADELQYCLKRLQDGLGHTREDARSGYSVALAQVLSVFEEISLKSTLDAVKLKHDPQRAGKKQIRAAVFGRFFGILALSQSTRLHKEPQVMLECVQQLQTLSQYREHLKDLPKKTMAEILSETQAEVFEELLLKTLQADLTSALSSPDQLELLLVAMHKFPSVLKPKRLKKLLGSATIITKDNVPKLVCVLKTAARSVKKECVLPSVALELLQASLREETFNTFWNHVVIQGLMSDLPGPSHFLSFRLLGASLPLLSVSQLEMVLSGDVMKLYGEHVLSAQLPERFKFAPEMERAVADFLQGCPEAERQLAVVLAFTRLTNQGCPVVPSSWKPLELLVPAALQQYVRWLRDAFCQPPLQHFLDFSTRRQKEAADESPAAALRFRKWLVSRLAFIGENHQMKKDEDLVLSLSRFLFFHAFFTVKKPTPDVPESLATLSQPLDPQTRASASSAFFSVLQSLSSMPVLGDSSDLRRAQGLRADGSLWIYSVVQFSSELLSQHKCVRMVQSFSEEQRQAWDSMLESVEAMRKKIKKSSSPEHLAFQHLFLLVGIQMFKVPKESVELLRDVRSCMEEAQAKKPKKKTGKGEEEPHWVEVVVEILLSLLSQPSRLVRIVCKTVFGRICPHLTEGALQAILNVLDPSKDEDESGVMVTDEETTKREKMQEEEDEDDEDQEDKEGSDDSSSDDDDEEDEATNDDKEVDQSFRLELMKVLQGQNALATEEDGSDEEELDDAAMMKLDGSLAALFLEQKNKMKARKEEKDRIKQEKVLVRDFKIKVLDMVEMFLNKSPGSVLVLLMVEPLLAVIESEMTSEISKQEQDFLGRVASIFRNQLCRGKYYCREIEGREAELHEMLERLIGRAQKLSDSSVALYYFSAALYVVKVLRGVVKEPAQQSETEVCGFMGKVDVERVSSCFRGALSCFMTKRKSPLTGAMFCDLFTRFPVLCVNLLHVAVENISGGVREHQQAQACVMVLRALQGKELKSLMCEERWSQLHQTLVDQLRQGLQHSQGKNKSVVEKIVKMLELCRHLIRTIRAQNLAVDLGGLETTLKAMTADGELHQSRPLVDTYWSVMKLFGLVKPKSEKVKPVVEPETTTTTTITKKKKGFLPETKKRKRRQKPAALEGVDNPEATPTAATPTAAPKKKKRKNKKRKTQTDEETQPAAKKTKAQPQTTPQVKKKKKKKKKQQKSGGPQEANGE